MIEDFLSCSKFVVIGASKDRTKFGNKILRNYIAHERAVTPIHPKEKEIEGIKVKQLTDIAAEESDLTSIGVSVVTPPKVSKKVVEEGWNLGFRKFWLQPGAEGPEVLEFVKEKQLSVIHSGPCVLVELN